jgi:hypothetical protein
MKLYLLSNKQASALFILTLGVILLSSKAAAEINTPVFYKVAGTNNPPSIDGVFSDSCWSNAEWITGFKRLPSGSGSPEEQTRFAALYDDKYIYLAVECHESQVQKLIMKHRPHDGAVWEDDDVEIFLDINLDRTSYYHFAINPVGAVYDSSSIEGAVWNPMWQKKAVITNNGWSIELAIPFRSLGLSVPNEGEIWGVNICRTRRGGKFEYSVWSPTYTGFHDPQHFGSFVFNNYKAWVLQNFLPCWEKITKEMPGILSSAHLSAEKRKELAAKQQEIFKSIMGSLPALDRQGDLTTAEFAKLYTAPKRCQELEEKICDIKICDLLQKGIR